MPAIQSTGDTPPVDPRGAVTPPETSERGDPGLVQRAEQLVGARPGVDALAGLDLTPVQRDADDVDAERVELGDPRLERAGPVLQPRVVLDAAAQIRRGER